MDEERFVPGTVRAAADRTAKIPGSSLRQTPGEQLLPPKRAPYLLLLHLTKILSQLLIPALLGVSDVLVISLGALQRMV